MKCPPRGVACFMVRKECCNHACVEMLDYTRRQVHSRRESTSPHLQCKGFMDNIFSPFWLAERRCVAKRASNTTKGQCQIMMVPS